MGEDKASVNKVIKYNSNDDRQLGMIIAFTELMKHSDRGWIDTIWLNLRMQLLSPLHGR